MKCLTQLLRAVDDHDKALRRQSILDAALRLLSENQGKLPSVMSIASASGLAKGTVYLYFDTKEEIFLALLGAQYETLLGRVAAVVNSASDNTADLIGAIIGVMQTYLDENPMFLPLSGIANSVIEQNVDIGRVAEFKQMLNQHLAGIAQEVSGRWPHIPQANAYRLLLQTHAVILGLWQMQNWPDRLRPLMMTSPCADLVPDMRKDLELAIRNLWRGALTA